MAIIDPGFETSVPFDPLLAMAKLHSRQRQREIQKRVAEGWLPEEPIWAEAFLGSEAGHWVQAFEVRDGLARPVTAPFWIAASG